MKTFLNESVPEALLKMEKLYLEKNNGEESFLVGKVSGVAASRVLGDCSHIIVALF